ncbi:endonuclease domain-containing protein [Thiothrix nivea]|uniref:DUF559 domain-containing protein n=1 Tax=Thiothrix nivea (strain ATCC 35100 / DSM 5205 / JP2) TaxID=870187 RepID=A0A656HH96_THINJ|nr:DUF559 domain-containing protein [Thiothrix nivea]EIJ35404.1 protein of unknown function DUF559 [Thiothrix nivea DSM 5205]
MNPREKARCLRQQSTAEEALLWEALRNRRLAGYKFRRQYAIDQYIVDFICVSERLVIELDGTHHADAEQIAYDEVRSQFMQAAGYRILRFWNHHVEQDMTDVLNTIKRAIGRE